MSNPIVKEAVEAALKAAREFFPEEYDAEVKNDPAKLKELRQEAQAIAEEMAHSKSSFDFVHTPQSDRDLQKLVSQTRAQFTSSEQLQRIQTGLQIPSYRINFRFENGSYHADITKGGVKYMDSVKLDTAEGFVSITGLQIASIVVEAIGLLLSIIGITVPAEKMAEVAAKVVKKIMESPAVIKAIEVLKKAFSGGGSGSSKAKAVWELIKAVWNYRKYGNILIQIVKLLLSDLKWYDIMKAVVKITALLVSAIASGGAALVADIVLALMSAYEFIKKIKNLNELDEIRAAVKV